MAADATTATEYPHISLWPSGVAVITGTRFKIPLLIALARANGWDAIDVHTHYPDLTLSQVYSAFAYYHDHQADIDQEITRRQSDADSAYQEWLRSDVARELQAASAER